MHKKALLLAFAFFLLATGAFASTVTRSFSATSVAANGTITVTMTVDVTGTETYYAIDETIPSGWAITSAGTGDTTQSGHIKWAYLSQTVVAPDTTYAYTVRAPATAGTYVFSGIYMFEGMSTQTTIAGQTTVTVTGTGGCTSNAQCTSPQICCSGTCRAATCTAGSACCSADGCSYSASGTACGTTACPSSSCTGNTAYLYPLTCNKTCSGIGVCQACTCTATVTACGNTAYCNYGSCAPCDTAYRNCNLLTSDGCEINILTNNSNCGTCGNVCGTNYQCQNGTCQYVDPCTGINCGANAACSGGTCSCTANYGNCNGLWSDGCEANFLTSNTTCGSCIISCSTGQQCMAGICVTTNPCAGKPNLASCGTNKYCCGETCKDTPTGCTGCKNTNYTCSGTSLLCGNVSYGTTCTSDGIACTSDICNGSGTCIHPLKPAGTLCGIQNNCSGNLLCNLLACSATGQCNVPSNCNSCGTTDCPTGASGSCDKVCVAGACSNCTPSCIETNCTDGIDNDNDGKIDAADPNCSECFGMASGTACSDDGLTCTDDKCDGLGNCAHTLKANNCLINGVCYATGATNPSNQCQVCKSGTTWGSKNNGTTCNDNDACTISDICSNGTCVGTPKACGINTNCTLGFCVCNSGYFDCDNNTSNGCEVTNPANCPCVNGSTRDCTTADSCAGTQTCSAGSWGTCTKKANVCAANATEPCTPSFDGNSCSALTGTKTCDTCGTSWGTCIADGGAACCPGSSRPCDTPLGCVGTASCSALGAWGECIIGGMTCTPNETTTCTTLVNGMECNTLIGNKSCDACGTGWGACNSPSGVTCCPGVTQNCIAGDGCAGTKACDGAGIWSGCAKADPNCGAVIPPPPNGGGGDLIVYVSGTCINKPTTAIVLNEEENPAAEAQVTVVLQNQTVGNEKTGSSGKAAFTFSEPGEYLFYVTKTFYNANSQRINIVRCALPVIKFNPKIKVGQDEVISLKADDGTPILDFNVLLIYPDYSTRLLQAVQGFVVVRIEEEGLYSATIFADGFQQTVGFEAKSAGIIIDPGAEPFVRDFFGEETLLTPNYLIIWILAIAVISGLIIDVTKLNPSWFRAFMAITYTTLPLVVNHYTGNIWIAFTVIAMQTVILTAFYFSKWKASRVLPVQ